MTKNTISRIHEGVLPLKLTPEMLSNPLLDKLNEMAERELGLRLVIVFPSENGLDQVAVGSSRFLNSFCKLVQSSTEGADHCRMCHLVMTRSANLNSPLVHRCHTGASTLVKLVAGKEDTSLAILSSCCLINQDKAKIWPHVNRCSRNLHLPGKDLQEAFEGMTTLSQDQVKRAEQIMGMASEALRLLVEKLSAEAVLEQERKQKHPNQEAVSMVERELKNVISGLKEETPGSRPTVLRKEGVSAIDIVSEVLASKPFLPYTLRSVAAACHITPNHFSFLFHQRHGLCFSDFLANARLTYAKTLLKDLTLNISEVATRAGFRDAGYFARRFKQSTGHSPRQWRLKLRR